MKQTCDRCGAAWNIKWKCQVICKNCGAKLDCSDLFIDWQAVQDKRSGPHPTPRQTPPEK